MNVPVDPSAPVVAGLDIGGTFIKVGLLKPDGTVLHRTQLPSEAELGWDHFIDRIADALELALAEAELKASELGGVGVGYPGTVYPDTGLVSGSPNVPGSQGSNLVAPLAERFQRAILPINDASAAALGEQRFGAGQEYGARNIGLFTLGTGVGGGVVINGEVLFGAHHQGAELGHMVVDPNGPQCGCGCFGCLEAFCGTAGILRSAWRRLQAGRPSLLWDQIRAFDEVELTPKMISVAAAAGDAVALEVWAEIGHYLGLGCVTVINFMDPELIVIGGQIAKAGEPLFGAIRQTVKARQRLNPWPIERIVPARLGEDAGIVGAAAVVLAAMQTA
ncbi:MAG: ROK family protein [Armatimonadetes bacterium]|nr:ROK family protein [Armatimonadota bacterium]